ncbi:hypothetical protein FK220_007970 [Flavobacteriaceae bacterium TP-CH-4]|uniref:Right handed beta helix region n=1 Tax=Pelagihabitans pacificus TaxID=2696054 RepID=A0A967ASQ6_9FLAO|nr:hypothetical protein [Pelagihabitans pacificus]NHF59272.1 hypothetical protein [Pelagihabitans pacificus]
MQRTCYTLIIFCLIMLWSSCRKDFEYVRSSGNLQFSKDTVFLDTVFSNIGSSTYTLKVYNRSQDDILIPNIRLAQGQDSRYRLNVDGRAGKEFTNVTLLAQDSLFVFIETTFDISSVETSTFLYTDVIQFDNGGNQQEVPLVTLVQDAVFIFPGTNANGDKETLLLGVDVDGNEIRVQGVAMDPDQLNFTDEKPYVIYGYAAVPQNAVLSIDAGARVHFHQNSGIWVQPGASIQINGELSTDSLLLEQEVIFEGDRLEPEFEDVPGQWGTLWLSEGSLNNQIDHLTIKNATIGLLVEGNDPQGASTLSIKNSRIYNSSSVNLWARTASIDAENLVLGSAGNISLYCNLGGSYAFTHTTIANYWSNGFRGGEALRIDNVVGLNSGETLTGDLRRADFTNSIIDGNSFIELALSRNEDYPFNFSFTNCLIRFDDRNGLFDDNPLYDFGDSDFYDTVFLNEPTEFIAPSKNDFRLGETSAAIGRGLPEAAQSVPLDILGFDRTTNADLGAYQFFVE